MTDSLLTAVKVVLYEPQDPINIGAVIRAMKNMGVQDLRLVRPVHYDANRIEQIAHDTRDVVARIRHFDTLEEALADCVHVMAFTGRRRAARWEIHTPRSMAPVMLDYATQGPVALMFGREDHGLPSECVDLANAIVTIPTTEHYSLNLAQALLLGLYELHIAAADNTRRLGKPRRAAPPPLSEEFERTFADVDRALSAIAFYKTRNAEYIMRTVRSMVFRADPDARELAIVRTSAIEVLRTLERERRQLLGTLGLTEADVEAALAASTTVPAAASTTRNTASTASGVVTNRNHATP